MGRGIEYFCMANVAEDGFPHPSIVVPTTTSDSGGSSSSNTTGGATDSNSRKGTASSITTDAR